MTSILIDQINLIRALGACTETFRSSIPKSSFYSHNKLMPIEFYSECQHHKWNENTEKFRLTSSNCIEVQLSKYDFV
ncbi:hypothetical protein VCRA2123E76_10092 [Vibrio crassostreae]|nr:hypothetical protein VCRA2123E76_10092 [Vibrio crassostreae]